MTLRRVDDVAVANTLAAAFLALLAVIVLVQIARGTLGAWLAAKFLGRAPAPSSGSGGGGSKP